MRVPPTIPFQEARRDVKNFVMELQSRYPDYGIEFETYVSVPGAEIGEDHEMVKAIEACHQQVTGKLPERDTVLWCSDASVLTRFNVPTVNYGPSSGPRDQEGEKVTIETLVNMTRIYALIAARICGVEE
jgi:acetylornithine deacetylase/succinyl-diaminopimelate desuccinylase-like protein